MRSLTPIGAFFYRETDDTITPSNRQSITTNWYMQIKYTIGIVCCQAIFARRIPADEAVLLEFAVC
jgi:hypothetical protein